MVLAAEGEENGLLGPPFAPDTQSVWPLRSARSTALQAARLGGSRSWLSLGARTPIDHASRGDHADRTHIQSCCQLRKEARCGAGRHALHVWHHRSLRELRIPPCRVAGPDETSGPRRTCNDRRPRSINLYAFRTWMHKNSRQQLRREKEGAGSTRVIIETQESNGAAASGSRRFRAVIRRAIDYRGRPSRQRYLWSFQYIAKADSP